MAIEEGVVVDGLNLNQYPAGPLTLEEWSCDPPQRLWRWAEGPDADGGVLVDGAPPYPNRELTGKLRVEPQADMDAAIAQFAAFLDKLQEMPKRGEEGLPLLYTPAGATEPFTFYGLAADVTGLPKTIDSGWFAKAPLVDFKIYAKPFGYVDEENAELIVLDTFSSDTIAYYTKDAGTGLAISAGLLVPSATTEQMIVRSEYDLSDGSVALKITTGSSVAGTYGIGGVLKRLDATNYLLGGVAVAGSSSTLELLAKDGGSFGAISNSAAFTLAANTTYLLRFWITSNSLTLAIYTAAGVEIKTLVGTLSGANATKFGNGIWGKFGIRTNVVPADYRYDDLRAESQAMRSTAPLAAFGIEDTLGDVPAEGRLILTDAASQSRRFAEWGLEHRFADLAARLLVDSAEMAVGGFAGAYATRSGAYDADGSGDNVIRAALTTTPVVVCSTGVLSHVGTFRVRARVWASSLDVKLRLTWQEGDGPWSSNPYVSPPAEDGFVEVDLGLVTIPEALLGTQRWVGRIEAYSDTPGDTLDVDALYLIPAGEGYGRAIAPILFETPSVFAARDEFDQSAGNLNGKTAPVGGNWTTSGSATDLAVETTGKTAQRATTSDADDRWATSALAASAAQLVQIDFKASTLSPTMRQGVLARWIDASNRFSAYVNNAGSLGISKYVAGVLTIVATRTIIQAAGGWYSLRLLVDASGRWFAWFFPQGTVPSEPTLSGQDAALATGGSLASGQVGFRDYNGWSGACTRNYDNFIAAVPASGAVIFSGQSAEIRHDGTIREDSSGTYYGPVPSYRGSRFLLPEAGDADRTSRIAVLARRNDVESMTDGGVTDALQIQAARRSRFLAVPR